jgi:hypothetical protein
MKSSAEMAWLPKPYEPKDEVGFRASCCTKNDISDEFLARPRSISADPR